MLSTANPNLQRYKVLFVSGNYSRILSRLNRNITELDVRRAFTVFQLMTILDENHHSFLIVEHDPLLYEDASEMVEYIAQHLRQTSREATVLVYAPAMDPHLEKITPLADRVFCFYEMPKAPARSKMKSDLKMPGNQATLEVYSLGASAQGPRESGFTKKYTFPLIVLYQINKGICRLFLEIRPAELHNKYHGGL
jgi:DNA polymerase I